jgi:hypothetical protein
MTRSGVDVAVGIALWAVIVASLAATHRAIRPRSARSGTTCTGAVFAETPPDASSHSRALLTCLAAISVAFALLPHTVGWFGFVDGRLVPLILLLGILAVRRPALGQRLGLAYDRLGPIAAATMVTVVLCASYLFQREASGWREVLAMVPAQATLLNLPLDPASAVFTAHPMVHYDKLALAERPLVVSDVWFHQGSALYPTAANPSLALPESYSESDLRSIDWPAYRLEDWDFVLMRTRVGATEPPVPSHLTLAAHKGGWWLFRTARSRPGALRPSPTP